MGGFGKFLISINSRSFLYTRNCLLKFNQHISEDAKACSYQAGLPAKPKKPLCSFLLYVNHFKQELTQKNLNMKAVEIIREASKKWAIMDPDHKENFKEQYTRNYEQYLKELKRYQDSLTAEQKLLVLEQKNKHKSKSNRLDIKRKVEIFKKPKKPQSAFFMYLNENRKDKNLNISTKEWVSEMTKKWNNMAPAEKQKYTERAGKLMEQYKLDIFNWEKDMVLLGHPDIIRVKNRQSLMSPEKKQES